jgi:hypothetical protein
LPHPVGHTLRALSRWAVAASLGYAAGCGDDMGQSLPGKDWVALPCDSSTRANLLKDSPIRTV